MGRYVDESECELKDSYAVTPQRLDEMPRDTPYKGRRDRDSITVSDCVERLERTNEALAKSVVALEEQLGPILENVGEVKEGDDSGLDNSGNSPLVEDLLSLNGRLRRLTVKLEDLSLKVQL